MTQPAVPAAAPYTQAEIQAVVTQLIQSSIAYPVDTLGVRRTDLTFNDFQQAAAGIFILYPNAPFYVLWLGTQRLQDAITAEATICAQLLSAIQALGVPTIPINDVSPLFNAQAALQNLGAAAAQRGGTFTNIKGTPGFQQLQKNTTAFLSTSGQNAVQQGQTVQTPQQVRLTIPGLVTQLTEAHAALIAQVTDLVDGIDNYNSINLPSVVSASVLANASALVGADANALNALTPDQRLQQIRQVVLNLIATNTVVSTFCSFSGPSDFLPLTGTGIPYSDATHLATPATAIADIGGGAAIIAGTSDALNLTLDGGAPFVVTLSPSKIAELDGSVPDPFIIGDGTNPTPPTGFSPINNNQFQLQVGATVYTATLTNSGSYSGPGYTADEIAAMIQPSMPANITCEAYYQPLQYQGGMNVVSGVDTTWTLPGTPPISNLLALGVSTTSTVQILSGPDAGIYPITAVTASTITVTGSISTTALDQVAIGPQNRKVKVVINDPATDVPLETTITVVAQNTSATGAANTLGFYPGVSSSCQLSTPDTVSAYINTVTQQVVAGTVLELSLDNVSAHTNIADGHQVVFAEAGATGSQAFTGAHITFTVTTITATGSISTGDLIVLRGGPNPGIAYTITTVNGDAAADHALVVGDVVVGTGFTVGTPAAGVPAEFGPAVIADKYDIVSIAAGPNEGTYFVAGQGPTLLDIELIKTLPYFLTSSQQPVSITASYGRMLLTLSSLNTTTLSAVKVQGTGGALYFSPIPFTQLGTTPWFQLPSIPQGLQAGDLLYTYASQYNMPSAIYEIQGVVTQGNLIQLQPNIPDGVPWTFTPQPPPYAALAYGVQNDYSVVQAEWQGWLAAAPQQSNFFQNFNAVLNPVLVNTSPRAVDIGNAVNMLKELYDLLQGAQATADGANPALALDTISGSFTVEPVPPVDTMVTTYTAKGADLAVDTLLSGDFVTFFNLTSQGSSYAGALQQATVAVAMNDLPVRKINRATVQTSAIISQTASPDPEYPAAVGATEQLQQEQIQPPAALGSGQPSSYGTTIGAPATADQQTNNTPTP
jgi:hypothetical protein